MHKFVISTPIASYSEYISLGSDRYVSSGFPPSLINYIKSLKGLAAQYDIMTGGITAAVSFKTIHIAYAHWRLRVRGTRDATCPSTWQIDLMNMSMTFLGHHVGRMSGRGAF